MKTIHVAKIDTRCAWCLAPLPLTIRVEERNRLDREGFTVTYKASVSPPRHSCPDVAQGSLFQAQE